MTLLLRNIPKLLLNHNVTINAKACMTVFAPYYIEPVFKKDQLNELFENDDFEKFSGSPVKPPLNDQSCSHFYDDTVRKFTNYIMKMGKKGLARELVNETFENIKRTQIERYHLTTDPDEKAKIEIDPVIVLHKAVDNCKPLVDLCPVKRGGVTYQVPIPLTEKRSKFLSMKWLVEAGNDKERNVLFPKKMAWELLDAASNRGRVVKRKQDIHKHCESNRAYAHYRWS